MYRKRNRIQGYDYSEPNVYLITICTSNREHLFGFVSTRGEAPVTVLSPLGELVERAILGIPTHYTNAFLETHSILPNHIHLLLRLEESELPNPPSISRIIKQMKEFVTKSYGQNPWQKGFHDEVIRTERHFQEAWRYVAYNPAKWETDEYFTVR